MPSIDLSLDLPAHEATFVAAGSATNVSVTMAGTIVSTAHEPTPLFRTWYSNLEGEIATVDTISVPLQVGSHVITFTAKDQDDTVVPPPVPKTLYENVQHIGSAGGAPPLVDNPCVIHVFVANMIAPVPGPLSKAAPDLEAQAPIQWANFVEGVPPTYEGLNPEYHAVNQIRYRWLFRRVGDPPASQVAIDLDGGNTELRPANDAPFTRLRYTGVLPASITEENYVVTLRVEHQANNAIGHEVSTTVTIIA